ncbi:MAG: hypothetical protein HOP17_03390 [Acidobacteria bacterium]|nr:hypothetical protein [Acidobacteriota bacterium]
MKAIIDEQFYVIGNNLALDFVNSSIVDLTVENLVGWAIAVGLVDDSAGIPLAAKWQRFDLAEIDRFRAKLRVIVANLAFGGTAGNESIGLINNTLKKNGGHTELVRTDEGFAKRFSMDLTVPDGLLVPIAESFADLLCYGNLDYLRKCESPECILYYYDNTKNHKRRWCSMSVCGNRAKANKFYQRKKERLAVRAN